MKNFDNYQEQVSGWMTNVNAKIMLLENNYKMLKTQINDEK